MYTEKQLSLVTFEQAEALKKLGFDWEVEFGYNNGILQTTEVIYKANNGEGVDRCNLNGLNKNGFASAPTVALALKWFRDAKGIYVSITPNRFPYPPSFYINILVKGRWLIYDSKEYDDYEDAEKYLLDEIIKHLKAKQ